MEIHRVLLRGLMTRREIVSDGKRLFGLGAALSSSRQDSIPQAIKKSECSEVSATGMLDQLSRLLDQLSARITEGFHDAKYLETWVDVTRGQLQDAREALSNGCAEQAVLTAIQGTLGVYDILAELHTCEIVRDRGRQRGTRKGGRQTPKATLALQAVIRSIINDYPGLTAKECWDKLQQCNSDAPYCPNTSPVLEVYADGDPSNLFVAEHTENGDWSVEYGFDAFRKHFNKMKNPL